ncbi:hypothetical protein BGX33_004062 [Mortierella sp. NVP41]|nr:hypothetical protein BGX33_004062 [Mortierella sp. NVP41]
MSILNLSKVVASAKLPVPELRQLIQRGMRQCGIPGMSIAVLHKNQLIFAEGFGKRNETDPYTIETLQPIGSLTKAFTATAVGELVAEGKVDWDKTPISKYLSDFELKDPVLTSQLTFTDMLSHRTGMPNNMITWYDSKEPRRDLIKRLRHVDLPSKLSAHINYSNVIYSVAGEAAAAVAGTSYEDLVHTKVIQPLKLLSTGFSPKNMKHHSDNYALPHAAPSFEAAQRGEFEVLPLNEIYMTTAPAGDMYSNVLDLVRWGKAVMDLGSVDGEQILNKEAVEETLKAHTILVEERRSPELAPVVTYGMGWVQDSFKGQNFYRHNGAVSGFTSDLIMFPDQDLVIASLSNIVMVSQLAHNLPYPIAETVLDLPKKNNTSGEKEDWIEDVAVPQVKEFYNNVALLTQGFLPEKVPNKPPTFSDNLQAYTGEYSHPYWGKFMIGLERKKTHKDGKDEKEEEVLTFKFNEFGSSLEHYHFDAFVATFDDPLLKTRALISFVPNSMGEEQQQHAKDQPVKSLHIQELPAGEGISHSVFKRNIAISDTNK